MGGRGASSSRGGASIDQILQKIETRPMLDIKTKNKIAKELQEILSYTKIKVTMDTIDDEYSSETLGGKRKILYVNAGTKYMGLADGQEGYTIRKTLFPKAFGVLEKYNKEYKFDYNIDHKTFKSDGTSFEKNNWLNGTIYELYGISKNKNGFFKKGK